MKPFWTDPLAIALILIAVLIVGGVIISLAVAARCIVAWMPVCAEFNIREWIAEMVVVLLALILRYHSPDK